ncbi:hypothetical protein HS048_07210 [Planomonospora sp. ID91781]|uniref:DUF4352 domain-containing protein n=1 Tax=Planomonospora sphaerica TaxID=161355 RepID=A0A171C8A1_9ACTN|nr:MULTISPECIES: hypothetical protein [Planomonospora]MBG0820520.1 hypothetical protein [Planomonospora sp. ID91781]GAT66269.1 hypothetical protein PS9374_01917 [Planomonospora sphaerica]
MSSAPPTSQTGQSQTGPNPVGPADAPGPADGRRRRPRRPGRMRRAGALLTGLALAAAAVALQSTALGREESSAALTWTGGLGEEVVASRFSARVKGVYGARSVQTTDAAEKVEKATTSGIFVVVTLEATAHREPQQFAAPVLLTDDDKRYQATDKVDSSLTIVNPYIQPGWWTEGVAVFEVPVNALTGARIVLPLKNGFIGETYQPEVEVDLGLDEAGTQRLIADAKDVYPLTSKQ